MDNTTAVQSLLNKMDHILALAALKKQLMQVSYLLGICNVWQNVLAWLRTLVSSVTLESAAFKLILALGMNSWMDIFSIKATILLQRMFLPVLFGTSWGHRHDLRLECLDSDHLFSLMKIVECDF